MKSQCCGTPPYNYVRDMVRDALAGRVEELDDTIESATTTVTELRDETQQLHDQTADLIAQIPDNPATVFDDLAKSTGAGKIGTLSGDTVQGALTKLSDVNQEQTESISGINSSLELLGDSVSSLNENMATKDALTLIANQKAYQVKYFALLASLVPNAAGDVAIVGQYSVSSVNGGGIFIAVAGNTSNDSGLVINSTGFYWKRIGFSEVTPYMFGAIGDGVADDTSALNKAMLSGYPVFLPSGAFLITSGVGSTSATVGVSIRGSGDQSIIYYGATGAELRLVGDGAKVSNVWFRAKVANVVGYVRLGDTNGLIETNGATVENCLFGDEQTSFYATSYIRCYHLWYSTIRGNHFRGIGNQTNTVTAIRSYYSVNISCTDNTFLYMGYCLKWEATTNPAPIANHNEGWVVGNNAAAAIYTFFYATNGLACHINNNIIDICYGPAIYSDAETTRLTDNWIAGQDTNTQSYLIYLSGSTSVVHTNRIVGQAGIGTAIQIAGSPQHVQIQDNNIFSCGTGVSVATAAPYLVFSGNTCLSTITRAWDLSNATFLTYYGNHFRDSVGATFPLALLPSVGSNIIKKTWTTTVTATLSAGTSGQDFNVTLPTGLFSGKPLCQVTLASGSTGLVAIYVYDSSSASTAVIRVMNPSGSAIPSSTYRFCLTFTDQSY